MFIINLITSNGEFFLFNFLKVNECEACELLFIYIQLIMAIFEDKSRFKFLNYIIVSLKYWPIRLCDYLFILFFCLIFNFLNLNLNRCQPVHNKHRLCFFRHITMAKVEKQFLMVSSLKWVFQIIFRFNL